MALPGVHDLHSSFLWTASSMWYPGSQAGAEGGGVRHARGCQGCRVMVCRDKSAQPGRRWERKRERGWRVHGGRVSTGNGNAQRGPRVGGPGRLTSALAAWLANKLAVGADALVWPRRNRAGRRQGGHWGKGGGGSGRRGGVYCTSRRKPGDRRRVRWRSATSTDWRKVKEG